MKKINTLTSVTAVLCMAAFFLFPQYGWGQPFPHGTYSTSGNCTQSGYISFTHSSWTYYVGNQTYYVNGSTSHVPTGGEGGGAWTQAGMIADFSNKVNFGSVVTANTGGYYQFLFNQITYSYNYYTPNTCTWWDGMGYSSSPCWSSPVPNVVNSNNNVKEEIIVPTGASIYIAHNVEATRSVSSNLNNLYQVPNSNFTLWVKGTFNGSNINLGSWQNQLTTGSQVGVYTAIANTTFNTKNGATFGLGAATTGQNNLTMETSGAGGATLTSFFPGKADTNCDPTQSDDMKVGLNGSDKPKLNHNGTGKFLIENRGHDCADYLEFGQQLGGGMLTIGNQGGPVDIVTPQTSIIFDAQEIYPNTSDITVKSGGSYIWAKNAFNYDGNGGKNLLIEAKGLCSGCNGYVKMDGAVKTTNTAGGKTTIQSDNSYVKMGSTFTHNNVDGALEVLAGSASTYCFTNCSDIEPSLTADATDRSYIWIRDNVEITSASKGNALIRSYHDKVQMDKSVTYTDAQGANLWINGLRGVRTLGPTTLANNGFDATASGQTTNSPSAPVNYNTTGQGFVTYLSDSGYVDFGDFQAVPTAGNSTQFNYKSVEKENALLIEGRSRVFFGDLTEIDMANGKAGTKSDFGNVKIYSPEGWIKFADTVEYTGTNSDLIIYANGNGSIAERSKLNPFLTCDPRGGFILFDSITNITVTDTGRVWIRSNTDDVVIGNMFTYNNNTNSSSPSAQGEFILQAGQDIYGAAPDKTIQFTQSGDSSILLEAKKSIHTRQNIYADRSDALNGDITFKAGYDSFNEAAQTMASNNASYKDKVPTAALPVVSNWQLKGDWKRYDYISRFSPDDSRVLGGGNSIGSDVWFENRVDLDFSAAATNNTSKTTLRAFSSIYIDSTFAYTGVNDVAAGTSGNILLFAETGNIEAAVTRQKNIGTTADYIADDSVRFTIVDTLYNGEIRIQAGNQVWSEGTINAAPTLFSNWQTGGNPNAQFDGNILFNKPLVMQNDGQGKTLLSAARDVETQVMAPFTFAYDGGHTSHDSLTLTAGRHIETHAKMLFTYPNVDDKANITLEAGRLNQDDDLQADPFLGKNTEKGTTLATSTLAFDPELETGGVGGAENNKFAEGGSGNGSILLFDSLEYNYKGIGKILLVAENGNIESDPYLHRKINSATNPANPGNSLDGYMPSLVWSLAQDNSVIQHDAQITFNHSGAGITQLKAIDVKLHDKLAYYGSPDATNAPFGQNGQFYITAYDSILTRNIEYVNTTDTGSVFITTDKFKSDGSVTGNLANIYQGHIVLGYGADGNNQNDGNNVNDSIVFNFDGNTHTEGANVYIRAGYKGFNDSSTKGKGKAGLTGKDAGKGYGGNITFDYMNITMADGNHRAGGYMEISTPNGNIWGKDSINYYGFDGDLLVDAGLGSVDDPDAVIGLLDTKIKKDNCDPATEARTGNIMMKGGSLDFGKGGNGDAIFRTREGFIDTYDAFTVDNMQGSLLKYAGMDNRNSGRRNNYGDVSERDFKYTPVTQSGSVFFGADDNIMLNYGNSSGYYGAYGSNNVTTTSAGYPGGYGIGPIANPSIAIGYNNPNPYYSTDYYGAITGLYAATFNVNQDGYLWYVPGNGYTPSSKYHSLYRGCDNCSGYSGICDTKTNNARDIELDFSKSVSGGFASVATNYIDVFTKFTYFGGNGAGMGSVPGMGNLHGEGVSGFGLFIKSQFNGLNENKPEQRRATCDGCGAEMTYIGFHDDARVYTENQKSYMEAPVIEFFGHTEMNAYDNAGSKTNITLKTDSLIFHDSVIFSGDVSKILLRPFTTNAATRSGDMRYGIVNDKGGHYSDYGPAITMADRQLPVLELGYQRCSEPPTMRFAAPNRRSNLGLEAVPQVGGEIIVAQKEFYELPIFNTVVANNARISFIEDGFDIMATGFTDAYVRTDLLRIRNKVEFYTDPNNQHRVGNFYMNTTGQMDHTLTDGGMYTRHLHLEPGSELSIPGEDGISVTSTTVVGGYGEIHEDVFVTGSGVIAPGFASLMESDCQTPYAQGRLTIHNLKMEKDAVLRASIGRHPENCVPVQSNTVCGAADVLVVQDTIITFGRIPIHILFEDDYITPGCYTLIEYGDSLGVSTEYVRNFFLMTESHGEYSLSLDFSTAGVVKLCVSTLTPPQVQRWVDLPAVAGVVTNPNAGRYRVEGHRNFTFTAQFTDAPLTVVATSFYGGVVRNLHESAVSLGNNTYEYTIVSVTEPWTVRIGPGYVGNDDVAGQRVWSYRNTLYINAERSDVVSIYNMTGVLYKRIEIPEGTNSFALDRGLYVVTLKDGSVHKVVIQ